MKNEYWIPRHRYLELKNWCMQYSDWEEEYTNWMYISSRAIQAKNIAKPIADPTAGITFRMSELKKKMDLVNRVCEEVAPNYTITLMVAVTNNFSYDDVVTYNSSLPSRSEWYKTRHKFFYILSQKRD